MLSTVPAERSSRDKAGAICYCVNPVRQRSFFVFTPVVSTRFVSTGFRGQVLERIPPRAGASAYPGLLEPNPITDRP
jgi:hypothetical protein